MLIHREVFYDLSNLKSLLTNTCQESKVFLIQILRSKQYKRT